MRPLIPAETAPRRTGARPAASLVQGRTDWYRLDNALPGGGAALHIYDEIGYFGITASDLVDDLSGLGGTDLTVHVNSPGGDVFDGITIYNALAGYPGSVTVQVDGLAASIASVIAMAGDEVVMAPHSQMMIHDAMGMCVGNAADMAQMIDVLNRCSDNIAAVYAGKAGGDVTAWRDTMRAETWYSADEAVAAGLADRVMSPRRQQQPDEDTQDVAARWDLSLFAHAGRAAAPAPVLNVASPVHHTATEDGAWDGPAAVAAMPSDPATLKYCHAWRDAGGDPSAKGTYKFPHHHKEGGPANLAACRNGLARLEGAQVDDKPGVEAHLHAHLQDAQTDNEFDAEQFRAVMRGAFR